jgi:hypothetical protein
LSYKEDIVSENVEGLDRDSRMGMLLLDVEE